MWTAPASPAKLSRAMAWVYGCGHLLWANWGEARFYPMFGVGSGGQKRRSFVLFPKSFITFYPYILPTARPERTDDRICVLPCNFLLVERQTDTLLVDRDKDVGKQRL